MFVRFTRRLTLTGYYFRDEEQLDEVQRVVLPGQALAVVESCPDDERAFCFAGIGWVALPAKGWTREPFSLN